MEAIQFILLLLNISGLFPYNLNAENKVVRRAIFTIWTWSVFIFMLVSGYSVISSASTFTRTDLIGQTTSIMWFVCKIILSVCLMPVIMSRRKKFIKIFTILKDTPCHYRRILKKIDILYVFLVGVWIVLYVYGTNKVFNFLSMEDKLLFISEVPRIFLPFMISCAVNFIFRLVVIEEKRIYKGVLKHLDHFYRVVYGYNKVPSFAYKNKSIKTNPEFQDIYKSSFFSHKIHKFYKSKNETRLGTFSPITKLPEESLKISNNLSEPVYQSPIKHTLSEVLILAEVSLLKSANKLRKVVATFQPGIFICTFCNSTLIMTTFYYTLDMFLSENIEDWYLYSLLPTVFPNGLSLYMLYSMVDILNNERLKARNKLVEKLADYKADLHIYNGNLNYSTLHTSQADHILELLKEPFEVNIFGFISLTISSLVSMSAFCISILIVALQFRGLSSVKAT